MDTIRLLLAVFFGAAIVAAAVASTVAHLTRTALRLIVERNTAIAERDAAVKNCWEWAEACGRQAAEIARLLTQIETMTSPPTLKWDSVERLEDRLKCRNH